MTPTADDRGGSLSGTRREAGFLFGNEDGTSFLAISCKRRHRTEAAASTARDRRDISQAVANMDKRAKPNVIDFHAQRRGLASGDFVPMDRYDPSRFYSILFKRPEDRGDDRLDAPEFFADLNCDQIVDSITAGRDDYNLKPFFHACLSRLEAIQYRHEVMQDLERPQLHQCVTSFASKMQKVREHLLQAQKMYHAEQKQAYFLDGVEIYCEGIKTFVSALADSTLRSNGFLAFRDFLNEYSRSARFTALFSQVEKLKADLASVEYSILIRSCGFTVRKHEAEADYSAEVEHTFEKFQQGEVKDYRVKFSASIEMNHIEAKILEFVAKLYPKVFGAVADFYTRNQNFIQRTIAIFDREVQFYVAYLEYTATLKRAGLRFCYPQVSNTNHEVHNYEGFDIALAHKLVKENSSIVRNDFYLKGSERILIVSGPNQGGKTTFARTFGQLHYLASIGCPVPGSEAQLFLFDRLFTHFEKEEKVENLRGKLEDDLIRIHNILSRATPHSIIILNEIFTSTTIQDETYLSGKVMEEIIELGLLCVWVTFVDELASTGPQVVSMASTVVPENPALRTFKILRRPADGLAYAMAIAQKYGLTYDSVRRRIGS
jgi:DNA mismatch repair protein MutS